MHPHADIYVLACTGVHEKECVSGSCVEEDKSVGTVTTMSHYFGFLGCLDSSLVPDMLFCYKQGKFVSWGVLLTWVFL